MESNSKKLKDLSTINLSFKNNELKINMITHRENNLKFCNKTFLEKNGNLIKVK